ncbi:hypothetical protein BpHYR1_028417 [Brachionus plicatilis]|uniref:XK-related protein n=1 Tax=Brachionus plicatilis TaxID=10195 RepID=A0A3M7S2W8_BRAPC|nr:hypothetical protein BpHYR1_028417 [Brachionus plicatilis]
MVITFITLTDPVYRGYTIVLVNLENSFVRSHQNFIKTLSKQKLIEQKKKKKRRQRREMLSSTSFAVFETNLDSCPKCGKNICEHASVADVINLPNSLSQDFSTYSSDSSLIKQLFNDSTSSTVTTCSSSSGISKSTSSSSSTASSTVTDSVITQIHRPNQPNGYHVNITENRLQSNINNNNSNKKKSKRKQEERLFCSNESQVSGGVGELSELSELSELNESRQTSSNYHKITVIFVLIGLFSFNFLQETFLLVYYLNSHQIEWLLGSLISVFTGQSLTLIVCLIAEINANKQILFSNPFGKVCLLIPGCLPLSCFVQFFRLILNYKKSCAQQKFQLEFKLSLLFYFNSLFYTLPLIVVNSCYLSTNSRLNWYYTDLLTVSSDATALMFIFSPDARPPNHFMILLVSIFVSISIGLCLFITYYELIKQMRIFAGLKHTPLTAHDTHWLRLGIIELLVYFCFKFCLITSRLCILALFWYLFNQLLLVFVSVHILLLFVSNMGALWPNSNTNIQKKKHASTSSNSNPNLEPKSDPKSDTKSSSKSKLNDLLTIKIISVLGLVDLFINQTSELKNIKRVFAYYLFNFVQNTLILTYWLVNVLHSEHATQKICYTTLIYLSVLLFNVFGLILKYLHIHIIKKRYAKLIELNALAVAATTITTSVAPATTTHSNTTALIQ